jgi:hypothetical protein
MAKFKCNHSGNIVEFLLEHDIKTMRVHPEYTEVVVEETPVKTTTKKVKQDETNIGRNDTNNND